LCFNWQKDEYNNWVRGAWKLGTYDYIIVDEAQDFSISALDILNSHSKKILFYGDSAQNIYSTFSFDGEDTVSMEKIKMHFNYPLEQLVFNHRLPKTIARIAEYLNEEGDDLEGRCKNEGSELPKILDFNSFEEQMKAIKRIINTKKYEDVGILFSRTEDVKKADSFFKDSSFNVETKIKDDIDLNFNTPNPKIMPYKSSKGLQFEVVFLPNCSTDTDIEKNSLYVALTRSYQSLYVLYSGFLSSYFDDIKTSLYGTTEFDEIEEI